jgi:hypothetical protein
MHGKPIGRLKGHCGITPHQLHALHAHAGSASGPACIGMQDIKADGLSLAPGRHYRACAQCRVMFWHIMMDLLHAVDFTVQLQSHTAADEQVGSS